MKKAFIFIILFVSFAISSNSNPFDFFLFQKKFNFGKLYYDVGAMTPSLYAKSAIVGEIANGRIFISKNEKETLPIASLTKLLTALTILNGKQDLDELLEITDEDIDTVKNSTSHIPTGTFLTRGELLNLALMSSENRCALCLARNYKGGFYFFTRDMNRIAQSIGANNSYFVDPCGLAPLNVSTALDLFEIGRQAYSEDLIRDFTTRDDILFESKGKKFKRYFGNTNDIVIRKDWIVKMSKTGYTLEASRCLILAFEVKGVDYLLVLLGENSLWQRDKDAETIKKWIEDVIRAQH